MLYLIRLFVDVLYAIALYAGYCLGQKIGMKYMFTDMYIAKVYCGIIGVAVVVFIFSKIKGTILFFVKAVTLYAVATNKKPGEAFSEVLRRLGKVIGVVSVTKILTEAIDDVQNALMGDSPSDKVTEMFPILQVIPFSGVIDMFVKYYAKSFTYLDECILAYSFALDTSIIQSLKDAFMQFLKKAHVIMVKLIMSNFAMTIVNCIIAIIGIIFYFTKIPFSFHSLIVFYIVIRAVMYIIDDAILEPLLLQNVIEDYVNDIPTAADELAENIDALNAKAEGDLSADEEGSEPNSASAELSKLIELPAVKKLLSMTDTVSKKSKKDGDAA